MRNWITVNFYFPSALPWKCCWSQAVPGTDEPSWLPRPCSPRPPPQGAKEAPGGPTPALAAAPSPDAHTSAFNQQQLLTSMQQLGVKTPTVIYAPIRIFWYLEVENFSEKGLSTKMTINLNVFTTEDWPEEFIKSLRDLMYIKLLHKVNTLKRTRQ